MSFAATQYHLYQEILVYIRQMKAIKSVGKSATIHGYNPDEWENINTSLECVRRDLWDVIMMISDANIDNGNLDEAQRLLREPIKGSLENPFFDHTEGLPIKQYLNKLANEFNGYSV